MSKIRKKILEAKAISLQSLEQRFLLDGAAVSTFADAAVDNAVESDIDAAINVLPVADQAEPAPGSDPEYLTTRDEAGLANTTEVVFIDRAVVDSQSSNIADLLGDIDPDVPVYILDASKDGVEQINSVLAQFESLDAVHIVSHGEQGRLHLGSGVLDSQSMQSVYTDELAAIGSALSEHGDILLYGCDFSAGETGKAAAERLSQLTGADIAASEDFTGAADKGGDWELEHTVGLVQARVISSASFGGILIDTDGDGIDDADDMDIDGDGITDLQEGASPVSVLPAAGTLGQFDAFPTGYRAFLQVINDGAGMGAPQGQLFAFNGQTSDYTPFPEAGNVDINGIGFAENINAPVGLARGTGVDAAGNALTQNDLVKFDVDGEIFLIGSTQVAGNAGFAGEIVGDHLHVRSANNRIDVVDVTGAIGSNADTTILSYTLGSGIRVAPDLVEANGRMYQLQTNSDQLQSWDITAINDGDVVPVTSVAVAGLPSGAYGASFPAIGHSGQPEIYFSNNGTGAIYQIQDYDTANPVAVQVAQGVPTGQNDGAAPANQRPPFDADGNSDGTANHLNLDSDNDGISDLVESGNQAAIDADTNNDGLVSNAEAAAAGFTDTDNDGVFDQLGVAPVDSDGDGVVDYLDLDSDNDGIPDIVEAQATSTFTATTGTDGDDDGVDDAWDSNTGHGATFALLADTDSDGVPDYLDSDSDNDSIADAAESGLTLSNTDDDGDGIDDSINASYANPAGDINDPINDLDNIDQDSSDVDYRSVNAPSDKDGDGVADIDDLDDDNDGILDTEEGALTTADSLLQNGGFNENYIDPANPGTPYVNAAPRFAPTPWGYINTPDTSSESEISFSTNVVPRSNLTGFEPSPSGGSFLGFRTNEGIFNSLSVVDASEEITLQFDYTEWNRNRTAPGAADPSVNIEFRVNSTSPNTGTRVATTVNFAASGGTEGTWQPLTLTFVPQDYGIADGSVTDFFLGSVNGPTDTWGFVDNLIVQTTVASSGRDTDGDGIPDHCELDSDNDGISDLIESGNQAFIDADTNGDGTVSLTEATAAGIADLNGDGVWDSGGLTPVDTDGDGVDDYLDLDSDNDGIPDAVEAQPTTGYQSPSIGSDSDGDGVVETFDSSFGHGATFTAPVDTDNDSTPDYLDSDSDNDGQTDADESGLTPGADTDNDGIGDGIGASYNDTDGPLGNPSTDIDNETGDTSEVGYREAVADLVTVKTLISGDSTPPEGDTVTFQIVVDNNGVSQATNVALTDLLPAGLTATANNGTVSQGAYNAATGVWTIGTIANGSSATLTLEGTVDAGEGGNTINNTTTAATTIDQTDPSTAGDDLNESVIVEEPADLVTVKSLTSGDSTPDEGDTVTFLITVDNTGTGEATNVSLTDLLPAGLTATANNGVVSQGSYSSGTGLWTVGTLANGDSATLTLEGTVDAGEGGNTIDNTTTAATGDQLDPSTVGDDLTESVQVVNEPPVVVDPDPTSGTPSIDPLDAENIIVPAVDGQPVTIDLDDYLTDPNGHALTITPGTLPAGATFNAATNELTFVPTVDNNGDTVVPFTVDDGNGGVITPTVTIQPVNPGPDAVDETVATTPDTPVVIDPLANDTDPDNDPLTITEINGVALTPGVAQTIAVPNGTVDVATDGTITVTPDTGYAGDIDVPYTIEDQDGATDSAVHTVEVPNTAPEVVDPDPAPGTPSIDPLDAENIIVPAVDGQPITIDLDDYLTDDNGDPLTITAGTLPAGATFNAATNELTFVPTVDNNGDTVVPFTVDDGNGGVITPTVTIQPVNPGPDAVDETVTTTPDTPVVIDPLANDSDPDNDPLTITEINGVALTPGVAQSIAVPNGTVDVAADGTITVTPDTGFAGDIDVPYTIEDQDGATDSAVHTVEVPNTAPEVVDPDPTPGTPSVDPLDAENIIVPAVDGQPITIDLDDYLTDDNGDPLTITAGTLPAGATFNAATNELTFVPAVDNNGDTVIPFTVDDGNGGVITPTVTIQPVNPGPDAVDETVSTAPDTPVVIDPLSNDTDPDNDPITITEINGVALTPGVAQTIAVANGSVEVAADGTITVTPDTGFAGDIDVPYTIVDQDGATDAAIHTVQVANTAPTVVDPDPTPGTPSVDPLDAENIIVPAVDGQPITIDLDDYLTDGNGDPLTITAGTLPAGATFNAATNELTFVPTVDNNSDTVIPFTVDDGNGGVITPTVTIQPVNPGPDAVDETVATTPDTPIVIDLLSNDSDPDGDPLTVTEINGVALTPGGVQTIAVPNGSVEVAADGTVTVTPDTGFAGDIDVPYTIVDQDGATDSAIHTVEVPNTEPAVVDPDPAPGTPSIDPLDAENIIVPAIDGQPITIDLDDYLTDHNGDPLTFTAGTLPAGATFNAATNELTFVPTVDNNGDTVIPFTVDDGNGGVITPTVTIQPVNPGPDAADETVATTPDTLVVIDPLANDTDPDNDPLTIMEINGTALTPGVAQTIAVPNGTVDVAADGTITVTPNTGFAGDIDVPYTIEDQDGATDSAVHTVQVPNTAPEVVDPDPAPGTPSVDSLDAENIIVPAVDGQPITIDLDDYLTDDNGDPLVITAGTLPAGATFNAGTNELTFVPTVDNVGDTVIPFTVDDGNGGVITPTVTIQPVNPGPDAVDETVTTTPDTPVVIDPLANDTDPDNDPLTITEINGVALTPGVAQTIAVPNGTVDVAADGTITVTPDTGYAGDIDVPYTIEDQDGATDSAVHAVEVPNAVPEVVDNDPAPGTPSIDPLDAENIIVPAIDAQPVVIDLDDYLSDPNGDALTITPGVLPADATFDPLSNVLTVIPPTGNGGDIVIPFTVDDGNGGVITPTVTIQPVNPGPDAVDETVTTTPDAPVVIDPLANDTDPDGDTLTVTEIDGVALAAGVAQTIAVPNGTVEVAVDGTITVTPDTGFAGDIDVPYTIEDQDGATDSAVHTVEVPNTDPAVVDPDPTPGTPLVDPLDAENIIVPAVDGQPITIDLDDYLTDHNGDPLSITAGTLPAGATFNAATNELTFVPTVDNAGDTVIPFTVDDGNGGVITPTVTIQPVNPGPDAVDQSVVTAPDTPIDIDPLANDSDPDGDPLTITEINGVALVPGGTNTIAVPNGTVTVAADGTITVTPDTGYAGDIDVPYTIEDQDGSTDSAVHTVTIGNAPPEVMDPDPTPGTPSVDPLDAENIIVPAIDGQPVTIDLDDYLTDPNGHSLSITPGTLPAGATFNPATNELTFVPTVDNIGDTVIPFTVDDGNGGVITPTVTIQPVNPVPDAVDETVATTPDTPVVINPLTNDSDPDGDPLSVTEINGVALTPGVAQTIAVPNGTVDVAVDGTITVTPDTGFAGDIDVPYTIVDQDGDTDTAIHTVEVPNTEPAVVDPDPTPGAPSIDPLDAENIIVPAIDGQPITIDLDDYLTDHNGDPLTITAGTLPAGATFNAATNELTFVPTVDNVGDTVIPFTVDDGNGGVITPTVTIQPVNPGPDAVDETVATTPDTPVVIDPLANDTDPDNDPLTITEINGIALTPGVAQTIAVPNGTVDVAVDGTITVTPDTGFAGDIDVPYTIEDQDGATDSAVHTVEVPNTAPEVVDPDPTPGTPSIDPLDAENIIVPAVDGQPITIDLDDYLTDHNGDPLTITPGTLPASATFNAATNELTFVPTVDNNGDTVIPFTADDGNGGVITPTVTIQPVNPGPDAVDQTVVTVLDTPIDIDPLANDNDLDADPLTITEINGVALTPGVAQTIAVPNGSVDVAVDGTITVTPDTGFAGDIDVPYTIEDQDGATDSAVHTVTIGNAPPEVMDPDPTPGTPSVDPLDAENIIVPAIDGQPITIDLDDYLTDPNGHALTITPGTLPAGAAFNAATNELTFVPAVDNVGDTVIPFTVDDGNGGVITPTVTIQPVNPGPDAVDETVTTAPDTPIDIDPLANDSDPDGDPLTITEINGVALVPGGTNTIAVPNGTVTVAADGTVTVTPNAGFAGNIDVPYTIVDQDGATDTAIHTVEVPNTEPAVVDPDPAPGTPSVDPLDAENIIVPAVDGQPITIDLDDYLTDHNGDPLTITAGTLPAGATFNAATNELTFVPTVDNVGGTVIPFTVDDGNGGVITPTVTIQPVNPSPDAVDETVTTTPDTPVAIDPLANDTDPDSDPLTITEINGVALTPGVAQAIAVPNGSVDVAADGTITVTPDAGYAGDIDVPYTIVDQDGATDTAIHTVEVPNTDPVVEDPDPTPGTPSIDPLDAENIIVPAIDGQPITIDLDDYLTDHNGDPLAITAGTLPAGATFNAATNELTFVPTVDNVGDTVIPFTVDDGNGGVITPTVTIQPVNPGPDAVDQTVVTAPDTPIDIDPLANDNDPDGDPLTITEINGVALVPGGAQTIAVANGTVTVAADGTITVTPDTGYAGDIDVPYTIEDQDGATDSAVHTVTIGNAPPDVVDPDPTPGTPSIDPLDAENIIVPAVDGQPITIDLDDYLTDPNGHALTITPGTLPAEATFNAATNELTFVPTVDNVGATVIPFTVDDGNGGVITPTVTIQPVNPGPDAVDQTVVTAPDTPVAIDPLANDNDPDGDPLTITEINGVALVPGGTNTIAVPNGTVTVAADGTITVTPDTGYAGDIDVPYTIEDQDGATDSAVHTVTIGNAPPEVMDPDPTPGTPSIDPLDAENIIVPAIDGQPITIDLDDYLTDPNGHALTITPGTLPAAATFNAATNELTFVPTVDNTGDTVIPFTVDDGNGGVITPTVTIQPVNPGPDAVDETVTTTPDTPIVIDPLSNDSDPDGDPLAVTEINGVALTPGVAQTIAVPNGSVEVAADGTITVTPDTGYAGDIDVPYTIEDQDGATDSAVHTVAIGNTAPDVVDPDPTPGTPSIDPLDAQNIVVPAVDGEPVTIDLDDYLTDHNGDPLTITAGTMPTGATFNAATNELTFVPTVDNVGDTVIPFTVDDGNGGVITPTVTIQPVNPGPDAVDETVTTAPDTPVVVDLLANDSDPDGDPLTITEINGVALVPGGTNTIAVPNGTVTVAADGTITVTPDTGYAGDIDVPYVIEDQDGAPDTATHTVVIGNTAPDVIDPDPTPGTPSIDPLDAQNIVVPAVDGEPVTIDLDDYLTDHNGDPLTITAGTLPAGATFNAATNELTFVPTVDNVGDTVVPFSVDDGNGGVITPTVTIQPVNPGPDAVDETVTTAPDTPVVIDPLGNDADPDSDPLTITEINGVALVPGGTNTIAVPNGTVTVATDGTITVIPDTGYAGDIDVPYTIEDQDGATDTATHTVVIGNTAPELIDPDPTPGTPSIDPLDAENIIVPAVDGQPVTIDLDDYLTDHNGDPLTITAGTLPAGVTFNAATNELTFVPTVDNVGDTVIPFTIDDGNGGVVTPTVTIQPVNPGPDAVDETVTTAPDTPIVIDPLSNDTDPDGDPLTITEINGVALTPGVAQTIAVPNGSVGVAADGTITVTPDTGYAGDIDVPYTIKDQDGSTDTATHTVVIGNTAPDVVDPDPTPGTPSIDPLDAQNIVVPAVDGEPVTIDLDDYLADHNGDPLTITAGTLPAGATFNAATNELTFVPTVDNVGDTVVPFSVDDGNGGVITPTVTIQPVNPGPDAVDETVTTAPDTPVVIDPLGNDADPDSDPLTITEINGVALVPGGTNTIAVPNGTVTVAADGTITVTPDTGFAGSIDVPYTIVDQDGATDAATHTVVIGNTAPDVVDPDPTPGTPSIDSLDPQNILVPAVDGQPVTIDLDDYLTDHNGDPLTITAGTLPAGATYNAATNELTFVPTVDNVGDTVIPFTVDDGNGGVITPTVTIQPVNPVPDAVDETVTTAPDTPVVIDPLSNDTDPDGDPLTITEINGVGLTPGVAQTIAVPNGSVDVAVDGTITVTPDIGYAGDIDVPYTIVDQDGATDSAVHTVTIGNTAPDVIDADPTPGTPSIDPLDPQNIVVPAVDGQPVTIDLDDNLTDHNGDPLTITAGTLPAGAIFNAATNELTFVPTVDNAGDTVIPFTVDDGNGGVITPTVTIQPVNPGPDAVDETVTTAPDTAVVIEPLSNDTDPDGDPLTITEINGVALTPGVAQTIAVPNGSVEVAADGTITVTPDTGFAGDIDVPYTIVDQDGATDAATHTVVIGNTPPDVVDPDPTPGTPSIDPLDAENIIVPAIDGQPITIDLNDYLTDHNGDPLTITAGTLPPGATFNAATNELTFVPTVDNVGDTVIPFTVDDGNGGVITPTVTIQPVNPGPDAVDETVTTAPDTTVVIEPLSNDNDPDGDTLTITEFNGVALTPGVAQTIAVPNGSVEVAADGMITVTPDTGFAGDIDVPYTIEDQDGAIDSAVHTVEVANTVPAVEDPDPTPGTPSIDPLNPQNIIVPAVDGQPITIDLDDYLTDHNGDPLTITAGTLPAGATFNAATNELTFVPTVDNVGDTVIPFTVDDGNGGVITPTVTIRPVNPGPDAVDETVTTAPDTAVVIEPLSNDSDPDGDPLAVTEINGVALTPGVAQTIAVPNGSVNVAADGTITVTPDTGYAGDIDVPYTIEDQDGAADTATHTVVIGNTAPDVVDPDPTPGTPSIDPLDPQNIVVSAVDGQPVTIDLDDYLTDHNGDPLTITAGTLPPGATFNAATNELTFVPTMDNVGDTVIPLTVDDGNGGVITPTVTIQPVNPGPDAVDETVTTTPDTPVIIDPLANDTDPDNDPLTITEINGVATTPGVSQMIAVPNGTVTIAANGTMTVTPHAGFTGDISVPYTIADQDGGTDTAVHIVEVPNTEPTVTDPDPAPGTPSIDPLNAENIFVPAVDGESITIDLDDYLSDHNGHPLTIVPGTLPAGATFVATTNELTFVPPVDNEGDTVIPFTVDDGNGGVITPTVTIQPVNPGPLATDESVVTQPDTPIVIDPLANDTDADGDALAITEINGIALTPGVEQTIAVPNGIVQVAADGVVSVIPDAGFAGDIIVSYAITDQDGATDRAVHRVEVPNVAPGIVAPPVVPGGPSIDPLDSENILVPAIDGESFVIDLDDYIVDPNGHPLTISPDSLPDGASYDPATNELTFVPPLDNVGDTVITFTVDDGNGGITTPSLTIQPVNPEPVAMHQVVAAQFETPLIIDPLADDTDPDGDPLVITEINGVPLVAGLSQTIAVPNGSVIVAADGTITLTPDAAFSGRIDVPYTIADQDGATSTALHSIDVENAPPAVVPVDAPTPGAPFIDPENSENILVPAVDGQPLTIDLDEYLIDPNGGDLTIVFDSLPEGASFDPESNELTFIPAIDNNGDVVLPLTVTDSAGSVITPTVTVQPVNPAPMGNPEVIETTVETPVIVDFLANDTDPDNDTLVILGVPELLDPASGTLSLAGDDWIFTPASGFTGEAVINYTVQDQDGNVSASTHTVVVAGDIFIRPGVGASVPVLVTVPMPELPDMPEPDFERDFYRTPMDGQFAILRMAEGLSPLDGLDDVQTEQNVIDEFNGLYAEAPVADVVVEQSEGFSSGKGYRGTISIDPTDECGRFFIDTIVKDDSLSVVARSTIDPERSSGVVAFSAAYANGQPLPSWISVMSDGEYMIDRSVDIEVVVLELVAHREDGTALTRVVEIDTLTGEIREHDPALSNGLSFSEAL